MKIRKGDRVQVQYEAQLEDGTVFDSSEAKAPVEFQVGAGQVIAGIDEALIGCEPGKLKLVIEPDKAYGARRDELVQTAPIEILQETGVRAGEAVELETADGTVVTAMVQDIEDDSVTFDLNHPLAGHTITFLVDVLAVKPAA